MPARLQRQLSLRTKLTRIAAELFLQTQRGIKRALRMVLVSNRGAEQDEDAVAGRLDDVAVVAPDGIDHQLERRVDDGAGLFRVEVLHQIHGAFDVSEEGGHHFALAVGGSRPLG
jgi:hypothetical protein